MPITGLTSASEPKQTHTGTQMPLDGLTPASKHTTSTIKHNQDTDGQSLGLHPYPDTQALTSKHTQKRKKMPGETSHGLLPTYLVWNEDQGDVVPLKGTELLTRNQGKTHY